jgi:hypothetical protein
MAKVLYTAHAQVTGGRDGNAKTADGALELNLRVATEMGGSGGGTNPEELRARGNIDVTLHPRRAYPTTAAHGDRGAGA